MAVVSAASLAPAAFGFADDVEDTLEYDLGHLAAFDTQPVDPSAFASGREAALREMACANAQALIRRLFLLPVEKSEAGPLALLPPRSTPIPREKHIPTDRAQTRWEKFALEKGIKKKKRERMVWDEDKKEWRPRFGFKRANDEGAAWAIPVRGDADPSIDPFEALSVEKKKRVVKNKLSMLRNMTQAGNANSETKEMKAARLAVAGISTASMGKFDKRLDGESNKEARKLPGEKKRALPAEQHLDKARDMDVIRRVLDGSIDAAAAASGASRSKSPKGGKKSKPGKVVSRQGAKKARRR